MNTKDILYEVEINQGNLKNVAKALGFGFIEIVIIILGIYSIAEYFSFAVEKITNILMIYYFVRIGITALIPKFSRSVVTYNAFIYYYPKRLFREQEILTIPFKDIVKVTADFHLNQSIYITYMHEEKEKKLQIYAYQRDELGKLQKLYNTLIHDSMYISYRSKEKEKQLQIELEKL